MTELDRLLDRCLQQVARTGDIEGVLLRYSQHADELRPLLEIALAVEGSFAVIPEPPGRLVAGRARLLAAADQLQAQPSLPSRKRVQRWPRLGWRMRLASAALAIVIFATAISSGVAWAASDSIPGDMLYPVKLGVEDLWLSLAGTLERQVDLSLQFSERRVSEVQELAEAEKPVPEMVATRMEQHILYALQQAASAPEESMLDLLERVAQSTQRQIQRMAQIQTAASEETQLGLQQARQVCQWGYEEARSGLAAPQMFRQRYRNQGNPPGWTTPSGPPEVEPAREPEETPELDSPGRGTATPQGSQGSGQQGSGQQGSGTTTPQGSQGSGQQGSGTTTPRGSQGSGQPGEGQRGSGTITPQASQGSGQQEGEGQGE